MSNNKDKNLEMDMQRKECTPKLNNRESMLGKMECSYLGPETLHREIISLWEKQNLEENFPSTLLKVCNVTIIFYINICSVK